ncbi:c-type cytochrome [Thiolapillus sp.]|uniref:c-type cytochrome n=1 Tax=Thiolapillus sp. TaxID=2017437 RepID=UPI003AF42E0C
MEPLNGQIAYSEEPIEKGKAAFRKSCSECHGMDGRGNIRSGKKLEDDWGNRIWPRDLTKPWTWRATQSLDTTEKERDETVKAIYTRLSIGIPGTPMPAHRAVEEGNQDPVILEDRWHIANYVYTACGKPPCNPRMDRWSAAGNWKPNCRQVWMTSAGKRRRR